ncbi:MAG TPA: hypothetical protein VM051_14440 [Usitatibacter sp.]|nr:hypothetical protein [Usitatibacter sp.]
MKHFLYLTNTRLVSLVSQGRRIVARREFAVSGAGATAFEQYLANLKGVPTNLITDLAEEDFRLDTIPHVGGRDRDAILARKLNQIFRNTPYRHALLQGREADGRRDDRVFYTAITNPELLRPWLDMLERLRVPLAGIHSAAVFSGVLLEELDLVFAHTLLVTFTPGDAMRQSYFRDREIKFSRITPIDLEEGQNLGTMIAEETTRTWQYLDSLRNFAPEDRLEVCILVHPGDRRVIEPELRDFAQLQYKVLDIEQVAQKLGLKPAPLDSTAEEVMVHLFLLRRAENHFASEELRRFAILRKARITLAQVAGAIVAGSLAWGAWTLAPALKASEADQRVAQQVAALDREQNEIMKSLPSFGVGGSTMRDAVSFYNGAIRGFPTLASFLGPVSGALRDHPTVRLTQIAWQATDDAKAMPRLSRMQSRETPPVRSVAKGPETAAGAAAPEDPPNPPFAGGRYQVALIEGQLRVPANDFRGALAQVEKLAADIGRIPGFRADVIEGPLDTSPSQQLQGRLTERSSPTMETRFMLRVVREKEPAA